jgi:hypothetical protein
MFHSTRTISKPFIGITSLLFLLVMPRFAGAYSGGSDTPESGDSTTTVDGSMVVVSPTGDTMRLTGDAAAYERDGVKIAPTEKFTLKFKPHAGDTYHYRLTLKGNTELGEIKASEHVVYNFTLKIRAVNTDGSIAMHMRHDSIRFTRVIPPGPMDSTGHTFRYDTRRKIDSTIPSAIQFKALVGQNVSITISDRGIIQEISNVEPIVNRLLGRMRDSIPSGSIKQFRAGIKTQAFTSILQQLFIQNPPDSSVSVGSVWTSIDSVPLLGVPSKSTITYKMIEARKVDDNPIGKITVQLTTLFPQKKISNANVSATVKSANVQGSGEYLFNLNSGMPVRKSTSIELSMSLEGVLKSGPDKGEKQSLSQKQSTGTVIELLGGKAAK